MPEDKSFETPPEDKSFDTPIAQSANHQNHQEDKFDYPERLTLTQTPAVLPTAEPSPSSQTAPIFSEVTPNAERPYESAFDQPVEQPYRQGVGAQYYQPPYHQPPAREAQSYLPPDNPHFTDHTFATTEELPPRRRKATMWIALGVIALLLFSTVLVLQAAFTSKPANHVPTLPAAGSSRDISAPSPAELSNSFREISKRVKPAVVYISITENVAESPSTPDIFGFGNPNQGGQRRRRSAGSGVIVTGDGYIITNNHVVANASKIEITLADSRKFKGSVIGTDPETDLAVIKIDAADLQFAVLGNSDDIQQGDWVLALGSPFGLQQTLTAGIVSATGREYGNQLGKFIQTDASINPGNSGGPLIGMSGEVVGINTFIISRSSGLGFDEGGNVGIGFAVNSNQVRQVFYEIVKRGRVSRGYLGVNPVELDEARARAYNVEPGSGVLIGNIPDLNAPAGKAGLRSGDIILTFDGKKVSSPRELTDTVTATPVGKSCVVEYLRDGQKQSVTVVLAERLPQSASNRQTPEEPEPEATPMSVSAARLGIEAQELTPAVASRLRINSDSGVLVRQVKPGSPAGEAGIAHGDVILRVDRFPIRTTGDLVEADKALKSGDEVSVQVLKSGRTLFLNVTIE